MNLFNRGIKGEKRIVYTVKVGWFDFNFNTQEDALKVFQLLSLTPRLGIEHKYIEEAVAKDKDKYRPSKSYYFLTETPTITMETKEIEIFSETDVNDLAEKRKTELEKMDAKAKKK